MGGDISGSEILARIEAAVDGLPADLISRSGKVFYTSRHGFDGPRPVDLLGLNPGGNPVEQRNETIARNVAEMRRRDEPWSDYVCESWKGAEPGNENVQVRVRHMFDVLGLDLKTTPAGNLIFERTRDQLGLQGRSAQIAEQCWPVHQAVIEQCGVRVIVCFGAVAGRYVCDKLGAHRLFAERHETYPDRHWISEARLGGGRAVVTVTHPSRADWTKRCADPSWLVKLALEAVTALP